MPLPPKYIPKPPPPPLPKKAGKLDEEQSVVTDRARIFFEIMPTKIGGDGWTWYMWKQIGPGKGILAARCGDRLKTPQEAEQAVKEFKQIVASAPIEIAGQ